MNERRPQQGLAQARVASSIVLALVVGCAPAPTRLGDTHVGRGQLYRAGRPDYDAFFAETREVQMHAMASIDDERRARAPIEQAMGGSRAPSASALADRIIARDRKNPPAPQAHADDAAFAQALSAALQSESTVARKYDPMATRASQLSVRADALLASTDHDFARAREREEVARELSAAKLVLSAAALRTRTVANDAQAFVNVASQVRKVPEPAAAPIATPTISKARKRLPHEHAAATATLRASDRKATTPPHEHAPSAAAPAAHAPSAAAPAKPADDFNP